MLPRVIPAQSGQPGGSKDFFAPTSLFMYTMHVLTTLAIAKIAFTPELRLDLRARTA